MQFINIHYEYLLINIPDPEVLFNILSFIHSNISISDNICQLILLISVMFVIITYMISHHVIMKRVFL